MQRDKIYGFLIFIIALLLLFYLVLADINVMLYGHDKSRYILSALPWFGAWTYALAPLMLAEILIFGIAAWIGWTMMTTPPPVPLEDIEGLGIEEEETGESS